MLVNLRVVEGEDCYGGEALWHLLGVNTGMWLMSNLAKARLPTAPPLHAPLSFSFHLLSGGDSLSLKLR